MTTAISQYLPMAIGAAISPMPIIAIIVLCVIGKAKPHGIVFLFGWFATIITLMAVFVLLGVGADAGSAEEPSTWSIILQFVFAFLLLFLAWNNWKSRPKKGEEITEPNWISKLSSMSSVSIFGAALLITITNVKNLPIFATVAIIIAQAHDRWSAGLFDAAIFATIASLGLAIPLLISIIGGEKVKPMLETMRNWLYKYNNIIMTVIFGYLGINTLSAALALVT